MEVAQKIAGHVSPSTRLINEDPSEEALEDALNNL